MINPQLQKDLNEILANKAGISQIYKGDAGGLSINIDYSDPLKYDTYVNYSSEFERNSDYEELTKLITKA